MRPVSVLLIDDDRAVAQLIRRFLLDRGIADLVWLATTADEALAQAETVQPDVILLDIGMPRVTGLELLPRLRAVRPDVPVVMLTGWVAPQYADAARLAGADGFVAKTRFSRELVPAIRRVVRPKPKTGEA